MPDKDKMYFNDYATLVQQQGMLQDHVRTSIYQFAVYENKEDFKGKRVLDVGAGTGILSFFAAKAGASHVYAVEASGMAFKAEKLAAGNGLQDVVTVLNKRVEDVTLDEKVMAPAHLGPTLTTHHAPLNLHPNPDSHPGPNPHPHPDSSPGRPAHLGAARHRSGQRAHDRELHRGAGHAAQAGRQDVPRPRRAARRALLRRGALQRADPEECAPPTHPHPQPSHTPSHTPSPSSEPSPAPTPSFSPLDPSPSPGHFWAARDFYGIDLAAVQEDAHNFYFSQPVVGHVPPHTLLADSCRKDFDFNTMSLIDIQKYTMKVSYRMAAIGQLHGVALWFDCRFPGSQREVFLSTAPHAPLTHWYQVRAATRTGTRWCGVCVYVEWHVCMRAPPTRQVHAQCLHDMHMRRPAHRPPPTAHQVRCLLRAPLPVGPGHTVSGTLRFEANESRGYNLHLELTNDNTGVTSKNTVVTQCALHHFQYTSQQSVPYDVSYGAASGPAYGTAPSYPGQNAAADEANLGPATGVPA